MADTGFVGIRLTGVPGVLKTYGMSAAQMEKEVSKRNLHVVTISFNGPSHDPAQRNKVLDDARAAMKFLAGFGAGHLDVFSPGRSQAGADPDAAFLELCTRCNHIGELAGELGFTAGLHNHLNQMVESPEEVQRFMSLTDPKLFGLSPDTAHLRLACHRILKSVSFRGWICVDLDSARKGPRAGYERCGAYVTTKLEPIYR